MASRDINLSTLRNSLHDVAPFSVEDTHKLIKKYNLPSNADRVFRSKQGNEYEIKKFLNDQHNINAARSKVSVGSFLTSTSGIHKLSTKHSTASTTHKDDGMHGGNKSRRNARTYRHSKKHKRVRHTRRKRTRRNHRSRRHR